MSSGLPKLSHLQFLVLGILLQGRRTGRQVRDRLGDFGVKKSGPAFYQLMARLEDAGYVQGHYEQEIVDGQIIRERCYRILASGRRSWEDCRNFQTSVIEELGSAMELTGA